jgi:hypothetical protein
MIRPEETARFLAIECLIHLRNYQSSAEVDLTLAAQVAFGETREQQESAID